MKKETLNNHSTASQGQPLDQVARARQDFYESMLKERRRANRSIPAPQAQESDSDTDWAEFNFLSGESGTAD